VFAVGAECGVPSAILTVEAAIRGVGNIALQGLSESS
jgi:hypothetical protein